MATKAQIIDNYFRQKNYYKHIPYKPIGQIIVDEVARMGKNGLFLSTACALIERESGGKNVFGCDWGSRWTNTPPYCNVEVTQERVRLHVANDKSPGGGSNGVGYTQLTYLPLVVEAQQMGGAHRADINMRVGFDYLNDLIATYGWPGGADVYNSGRLGDTPGRDYAVAMAKLEREWAKRLAASREPIEQGHGNPAEKLIIPRKGLGKDGNPNAVYVRDHPTNYVWREDIRKKVITLMNHPRFKRLIWVVTYFRHPPGWNRDTTSFDVWAWGGRGDPLTRELRREVFDYLFNLKGAPDIWWIISGGGMWTRAGGWEDAPAGPAGSDPDHIWHIHETDLDLSAQRALRG